MAVLVTNPSYFPRRLSQYVPAMQYASDVNMSGDTRISFGAPAVASATAILSAQSVAAGATLQASSLVLSTMDGTWGRCLQVVLSAGGTGNLIIDGWDYLNQPMSETIALNGATPVIGVKAFAFIRQVTWPTVGAVTMNLGTTDKLGLPYKCIKCISEELNGAVVGTLGTLVTPSLTDPATATTTDPRGTYDPQSTLVVTTGIITGTFLFAADLNSSNNGGLHGLAHFAN